MNGTDTKLKGNVLPFSHKVTELPRKSQVTARPAWLEDGRAVANTRRIQYGQASQIKGELEPIKPCRVKASARVCRVA